MATSKKQEAIGKAIAMITADITRREQKVIGMEAKVVRVLAGIQDQKETIELLTLNKKELEGR